MSSGAGRRANPLSVDLGATFWTLAKEGFYASAVDAAAVPFVDALRNNARLARHYEDERAAYEKARAGQR